MGHQASQSVILQLMCMIAGWMLQAAPAERSCSVEVFEHKARLPSHSHDYGSEELQDNTWSRHQRAPPKRAVTAPQAQGQASRVPETPPLSEEFASICGSA